VVAPDHEARAEQTAESERQERSPAELGADHDVGPEAQQRRGEAPRQMRGHHLCGGAAAARFDPAFVPQTLHHFEIEPVVRRLLAPRRQEHPELPARRRGQCAKDGHAIARKNVRDECNAHQYTL
jgi:hypothetical protein